MKTLTRYAKENRKRRTPAEKRLFVLLQKWKIGFRSQRPFDVYIVDFLIMDRWLIIEVDGKYHDFQKAYDAKRTRHLEDKGFKVVRFTNDQVFLEPETIKTTIQAFPTKPAPEDWRDLYGVAAY